MPMKPKFDHATVRKHLAAGLTAEQICRRLGCSKNVVWRVSQDIKQEAANGHVR